MLVLERGDDVAEVEIEHDEVVGAGACAQVGEVAELRVREPHDRHHLRMLSRRRRGPASRRADLAESLRSRSASRSRSRCTSCRRRRCDTRSGRDALRRRGARRRARPRVDAVDRREPAQAAVPAVRDDEPAVRRARDAERCEKLRLESGDRPHIRRCCSMRSRSGVPAIVSSCPEITSSTRTVFVRSSVNATVLSSSAARNAGCPSGSSPPCPWWTDRAADPVARIVAVLARIAAEPARDDPVQIAREHRHAACGPSNTATAYGLSPSAGSSSRCPRDRSRGSPCSRRRTDRRARRRRAPSDRRSAPSRAARRRGRSPLAIRRTSSPRRARRSRGCNGSACRRRRSSRRLRIAIPAGRSKRAAAPRPSA